MSIKMLPLFALATFAVCSFGFKLTPDEVNELGGQNTVNDANGKWTSFKSTHGWNIFVIFSNYFAAKSYHSDDEEKTRFKHFTANMKRINAHNTQFAAGQASYQQGINKFSDWVSCCS
jgi:hypothetical protein